jgi:hypothetical protein
MAVAAASMAFGYFSAAVTLAEETTGEKIQNHVDDAKKDTKKTFRKAKRKTRDAMGNGSIVKDAKDGIDDASDEITTGAKKIKRKAD